LNIWRLGHARNPCGFVPRTLCKGHHRFDDPQKSYRTLYGARLPITCLRELLADLRPNPKALQEFAQVLNDGADDALTIAGVVSSEWRRAHVLVWAEVEFQKGRFVALEAPAVLERLAQIHKPLLQRFGIKKLELNNVRSRQRLLTQSLARTLYDEGNAGILFHSRLDGKLCYALYEGRARLVQAAKPISLTSNHPDLIRICGEYTLVLRP